MPYAQVPPEKLKFLPLFGFQVLAENDNFIKVIDSRGEAIVDRAKPYLWFDSLEDALEMGAVGIIVTPSHPSPRS